MCVWSQVCEDHLASPFNRFNVSVPNGLLLQFQPEDTQGGRSVGERSGRTRKPHVGSLFLLNLIAVCAAGSSPEHGVSVRQSFPLHGKGTAGQPRDPSLTQEQSRTVTNTGAVIRYMRDGSTEVNAFRTR